MKTPPASSTNSNNYTLPNLPSSTPMEARVTQIFQHTISTATEIIYTDEKGRNYVDGMPYGYEKGTRIYEAIALTDTSSSETDPEIDSVHEKQNPYLEDSSSETSSDSCDEGYIPKAATKRRLPINTKKHDLPQTTKKRRLNESTSSTLSQEETEIKTLIDKHLLTDVKYGARPNYAAMYCDPSNHFPSAKIFDCWKKIRSSYLQPNPKKFSKQGLQLNLIKKLEENLDQHTPNYKNTLKDEATKEMCNIKSLSNKNIFESRASIETISTRPKVQKAYNKLRKTWALYQKPYMFHSRKRKLS
jgi:hypothetical protein